MVKKRIAKKTVKIVEGYIKRLSQEDNLPVNQVIIFGSQLNKIKNKWSDIDVYVVSSKFKDSFQALDYLWSKKKDKEVRQGLEPIGFSLKEFREGGALIQEIKKNGIEVK